MKISRKRIYEILNGKKNQSVKQIANRKQRSGKREKSRGKYKYNLRRMTLKSGGARIDIETNNVLSTELINEYIEALNAYVDQLNSQSALDSKSKTDILNQTVNKGIQDIVQKASQSNKNILEKLTANIFSLFIPKSSTLTSFEAQLKDIVHRETSIISVDENLNPSAIDKEDLDYTRFDMMLKTHIMNPLLTERYDRFGCGAGMDASFEIWILTQEHSIEDAIHELEITPIKEELLKDTIDKINMLEKTISLYTSDGGLLDIQDNQLVKILPSEPEDNTFRNKQRYILKRVTKTIQDRLQTLFNSSDVINYTLQHLSENVFPYTEFSINAIDFEKYTKTIPLSVGGAPPVLQASSVKSVDQADPVDPVLPGEISDAANTSENDGDDDGDDVIIGTGYSVTPKENTRILQEYGFYQFNDTDTSLQCENGKNWTEALKIYMVIKDNDVFHEKPSVILACPYTEPSDKWSILPISGKQSYCGFIAITIYLREIKDKFQIFWNTLNNTDAQRELVSIINSLGDPTQDENGKQFYDETVMTPLRELIRKNGKTPSDNDTYLNDDDLTVLNNITGCPICIWETKNTNGNIWTYKGGTTQGIVINTTVLNKSPYPCFLFHNSNERTTSNCGHYDYVQGADKDVYIVFPEQKWIDYSSTIINTKGVTDAITTHNSDAVVAPAVPVVPTANATKPVKVSPETVANVANNTSEVPVVPTANATKPVKVSPETVANVSTNSKTTQLDNGDVEVNIKVIIPKNANFTINGKTGVDLETALQGVTTQINDN